MPPVEAPTMHDAARLAIIEEIQRLKARYCRCVDTKDWEGFGALFTEDAVFDMSAAIANATPETDLVRGRSAIVAYVQRSLDQVVSVHHGHMSEIDVLTDTTARGLWAMHDLLQWPEGGPSRTLVGYGHYDEDYVLVNDRWLIARTRLTRLRVDMT